jgi:antitoxin component YwqK of YwqJK toxin-antitoxin module
MIFKLCTRKGTKVMSFGKFVSNDNVEHLLEFLDGRSIGRSLSSHNNGKIEFETMS